jgi:hypothetical protein
LSLFSCSASANGPLVDLVRWHSNQQVMESWNGPGLAQHSVGHRMDSSSAGVRQQSIGMRYLPSHLETQVQCTGLHFPHFCLYVALGDPLGRAHIGALPKHLDQ